MTNHPAAYHPSAMTQFSHELRIPLTGILGMAHILEKTPLNFQQKEYLNDIIDSAQRLLELEDKLRMLLKEYQTNPV